MTTAPAATGQPPGDLTTRIFRALYQEFDLYAINGVYIVVPKGTPWFAGPSLGEIAQQISNDDRPDSAASSTGLGRSAATTSSAQTLPRRS